MLRGIVLSLCCLLCSADSVFANIDVWEGSAANCTIDDFNNKVQINAAGTYGFKAWNPNTEELQILQEITVHSGVSGTVTVMVAYDAGGGDGATDVWEIDLSNAGTGNIAELRIAGDLGTVDNTTADNITGTVTVGGDVLHTIDIGNDITGALKIGGDLEAAIDVEGDIEAALTITGYLLADITADSADDITANGDSGTHTGDITVSGAYSAAISLNDTMTGTVTINGNVSAPGGAQKSLYINGDMDGSIDIVGTLSGSIEIEGDIDEEDDGKHFRIRVMDGGSFECSDMNLQYDEGVSGDDWLVIGYGLTTQQIENTIHTGNINLNGTLGGRVYVRGRSDLNIDVDTINAAVAVGRQMLAQRGKKSDPYLHPAASESA